METFFDSEERQNPTIEILFQDEHLLIVNKPSGFLVHKTDIDFYTESNMVSLLRKQLGKWVYPVHRLDKATSGVLMFGFDRDSAHLLCQLFAKRDIQKEYLAVVRGHTKVCGHIDSPLTDLEKTGAKQEACTDYELISAYEHPFPVRPYASARYSLLRVKPLTGRQHQIRRHLKHIFHPIIGDTRYGDGKHNQHCRSSFKCTRLMLHASALKFIHPYQKQVLTINAPTPKCFSAVLTQMSTCLSHTGIT
ncbi:MAG: pseudouridine synthase [Oligoflexales bacterium]